VAAPGNDERYCTHCGRRLDAAALVCETCGSVQAQRDETRPVPAVGGDDSGAAAVPAVALTDGAMLVVRSGPIAGSQFWLHDGVHVIGRAPDSRILLDDVTVSRRHAEIEVTAARCTLRDLGSLNGTYVNGERVDETVLAHGDDVMIGRFRLVFLTPR
jgi:hypothetical protein